MIDLAALAAFFADKSAVLPRRYELVLAVGVLAGSGVMAADVPAPNTSTAARPAAKTVVFSHKDWELACDNTRTCRAVGYHRDDERDNPLALLLERQVGVTTATTAKLMPGYYSEGETPPFPATLNMLINGRSLGTVSMVKKSAVAELNTTQTAALPKVADVQFVLGKNRLTSSPTSPNGLLIAAPTTATAPSAPATRAVAWAIAGAVKNGYGTASALFTAAPAPPACASW